MRLYLSSVIEGISSFPEKDYVKILKNSHVLQSFAYVKKNHSEYYKHCKSIMLDSGAFTIMNSRKSIDFNPVEYAKKYARYIKENNIELFLELDIDGVFGFDVYKDCLHILQDITGKEPIYVFHKWRGVEYYEELVKYKDYVALGDVSVDGGSRKLYDYFPWFIEKAHENNCKVHGLAFTSIPSLRYMPFDSIDSSSWVSGVRFGNLTRFDGHTIQKYDCKRTETKQLAHNSIVRKHDFEEWKKLSQYFDSEYEPIW